MAYSTNATPPVKQGRLITTPTSQVVVNALYPSAVGVDVHHDLLVCAYQYLDLEKSEICTELNEFRCSSPRSFADFAQWCYERTPDVILMESTGVLWRAPYESLEDVRFGAEQLALVNARDFKAMVGRKTDRQDAIRLAEYARLGKFRKSFVPTREIRDQRLIARDFRKCKNDESRHRNRVQKTFNALGLRLSAIFSNFTGKAATAILDAWCDGVDNLKEVVETKGGRLKAGTEAILEMLSKAIPEIVMPHLRQQREHLTYLQKRTDDVMATLRKAQQPYQESIDLLTTIPGIKETAARLIFAEIGDDLSSFPNAEHFASWIGVCPGNNESAGHAHRSGTPKGNKYLRTVLIECAQAVGLMRKGVLFQRFQAFAIKKGRLRGVMAMAHLLARIIFSILKSRTPYREVSSTTLRDVNVKKVTAAMTTAIRTAGLTLRDGLLVVEKTGEILVNVEDCAGA